MVRGLFVWGRRRPERRRGELRAGLRLPAMSRWERLRGLAYWRGLMFSREEEYRRDQDYRSGGDEDQRYGVRPRRLFWLG